VYDELADPEDVEWLYQQLSATNSVVYYEKYMLGHMSFLIAKDMDYFNVDAISLINKYATNVGGDVLVQ